MVFYVSVHHTEILPNSSLTANCKTSAFRGKNLGSTLSTGPVFAGVVGVPQRNTYSTVLGLIASKICGITVFGNAERT